MTAARQSEIADSVGAVAWECLAPSLQVTYLSATAVKLFGYPMEDWLKPGFLAEVVHPEDQGRCQRLIRAAAEARNGFEVEARMVASDGRIAVVHTTAQFVPATETRGDCFQGILIDVTDRRREQPPWIDDQQVLEMVLAQTPVLSWVVDSDLRYTWASGLSSFGPLMPMPSEVKGRPMSEIIPTDAPWRTDVMAHHRSCLEGVVVTYDLDLGNLTYHCHLEPCRDETGDVAGVAGVALDITERLKAQDEQAQLAAIVEASPDLIARADSRGRLLYLNRAGRAMLGIGATEDVVGVPVTALQPLDSPFPRLATVAAQVRREGLWTGEAKLRSRDGRVIDVSAVVQAHRDAAGAIQSYSTVMRDIAERTAREEQLRRLAEHDSLTGLLNRAMFESHLAKAAAAARRGRPGALLYMDLDRFKMVNDTIGHQAGDRFLVGLTRRLEESTRAEDVLARVGGDEFALLLHGVSEQQAVRIADGVRQTVSTYRFNEDGQVFTVGVSIGVAMIDGATDVAELLTRADWACYAAKDTGRNRVQLFDPAKTTMGRRRANLPAQLEDSLRSDRFRLLYQPVMPADGNEIAYHEVLLRMVDDDGQLVEPAAFLDTAERFGLSGRIDRWVVRHALARIEEAAAAGIDLHLAVNLSRAAVADATVSDAICAEVEAAGPGGRQLMFEVAESAVVAGIADAQRLAASLRQLGCRFAVDSFGAGLSSFAYLRHLAADLLKIDESFAWGIEGDAVGQALVRSMSELARGLGISTVAKGVEQASVRTTLAGLGVDMVQGYNIGMPSEQPV